MTTIARASDPAGKATLIDVSGWLRHAVIVAVYLAAYVLLDWVSYIHPVAPYAITPWNPPPGLSLALLLAFGLRYAPALFAAAVTAEFLVRQGGAGLGEIFAYASILAVGYTAIAGVLIRVLHFDPRLRSMRDLLVFTVTVGLCTLLISMFYISAHVLAGRFSWNDFGAYALQFWVGDVIGVIVTTPFLLVHGRRLLDRGIPRVSAEALFQALAIAAVLGLVFSMKHVAAAKFFYLLFLPLIWISVRHGFAGSTAGLLATQVGLIVAVQVAGYTTESVLEFQLLMLALSVTGAFLGMAVFQWHRASQALEAREVELNRAMRAAAAAEMASALAHELNQPLTAASNYVQAGEILLTGGVSATGDLPSTIRKARGEIERAAEVVRRLRHFYRGGAVRHDRVAIADLVDASIRPLRSRLERHRVRFTDAVPRDLPAVSVDRVQIEIVIHNLVSNAIDSVSNPGCEMREIVLEAAREGGSIVLAVQDSGPGVAPAIADQLFQTFATSKASGMGLGLAISRSIVESHGGRLRLEPTASGARFVLTLPIST